jgi:hypothetical protein
MHLSSARLVFGFGAALIAIGLRNFRRRVLS